MEKTKFAYCADEMLRFVAIWFLSAICLRYVVQRLYLVIILATAVTLLLTLLIRALLRKKRETNERQRQLDAAMDELLTVDRHELLNSICSVVGGTILGQTVVHGKTLIYPCLLASLTTDKLNEGYNLAVKEKKRLLILTNTISREVEKNLALFSEIPVAVLNRGQSCALLNKYGLLPQCKERKRKRRSLIAIALQRSKLKGYLIAAVVLLVSATFSPYAILCIIAASFNIAMSILCEVKGK